MQPASPTSRAAAAASGGLRRSFGVSTLRSLNRRQSYVVVLDFPSGVVQWHKMRRGVEVKRTFSFHSAIKLEKNLKDPRCLAVQFAEAGAAHPVDGSAPFPSPSNGSVSPASTASSTPSTTTSSSSPVWQKLVFFTTADERDLFCNLVHAAIVSGEQAVRLYQRLQTGGDVGEADAAGLSPALRALVGVDFCAFLIGYCSAQTALDLKVIAAANTASTHSQGSGHSSHPSQSSEPSLSSHPPSHAPFHPPPSPSPLPPPPDPTLRAMYGFDLLDGEVIVLQSSHTTRRDAGASSESRGWGTTWTPPTPRPSSAGPRPRSPGPSLSSSTPLPPSCRGNLFVTNYRLLYVPYRSSIPPSFSPTTPGGDCEVTLGSLARVIRPSPSLSSLTLLTKDYRRLEFAFDASTDWVEGLQRQIALMAFPGPRATSAFAFQHHRALQRRRDESPSYDPDEADGWGVYSPVDEYARLGLLSSDHFRLSDSNSAFSLCPSYPPAFVVPRALADSDLAAIAGYRSQGRLPAVVYLHRGTGAVLARAAQPLSGVRGKRSEMDEAMVALLRAANPRPHSPFHIIDARPYKAAMGNAVMGKGYENVQHYAHTQLHFMNIDNIHAVRHSLDKLAAACIGGEGGGEDAVGVGEGGESVEEGQWLARLDASQWLHYLRLLLQAAVKVALLLSISGCSVLTHCSDGWDRTSQLTSLTLLMLDPYHRTLRGFAILVEKEWLSFGHHFARRHGHGSDAYDDEQRAPIFLQWLDAVYQCWRQAPHAYEFNDEWLVDLYDAVLSARFGSFLGDCQREREEMKVKQTTESVWTHLLHPRQRVKYLNPLYRPPALPTLQHTDLIDALVSAATPMGGGGGGGGGGYVEACIPNASAKRLVLWERLHLRYERSYVRALAVQASGWEEEGGVRVKEKRFARKYHTMRSRLEQAGVDVAALEGEDSDDDSLHSQSQSQSQSQSRLQSPSHAQEGGEEAGKAGKAKGVGGGKPTLWLKRERKAQFATLSPAQVRQLNGRGSTVEQDNGVGLNGKVRPLLHLNTFSPPTPTAGTTTSLSSSLSTDSSTAS